MTRMIMLFSFLLGLAAASPAVAQPSVFVEPQGTNGTGNLEWLVSIAPENDNNSLAFELAFEIDDTTLVDVMAINATDDIDDFLNGSFDLIENPGNNPFTGTVTTGLVVGAGEFFFSAFGTKQRPVAPPLPILLVETTGPIGTLSFNGIAAEDGMNFNVAGSTSVPEPATLLIAGLVCLGATTRRRER